MDWFESGWGLSLIVFLPLVGAALVLMLPKAQERATKLVSLGFVLASFGLSVGVLFAFDFDVTEKFQLGTDLTWIPSIGSRFHIGIDGISLPMLVLSTFITLLAMVYSWKHLPEPHNPKAFLALILVLATGMNGTFVALDLVLFFIFFELVLLPMYFMIGIWGDRTKMRVPGFKREVETRLYASIKFFLFTLFGSVFMLLGFLALYFKSDPHTFDMLVLADMGQMGVFTGTFGAWVFAALLLGFAVKVPMWPLHTWLPDAHTAAPTVGSVLLAAVMLKLGTYGFDIEGANLLTLLQSILAETEVARLAGGLLNELEVQRGDRIAYLGQSSPELLELLFACARVGAILVPLNARMTVEQLRIILSNCQPRCIFVESSFRQHAESCLEGGEAVRLVLFAGPSSGELDSLELEALIGKAKPVQWNKELPLDTPVLIAYTSGTTGVPKGAVLTQEALFYSALNSTLAYDMTSSDEVLTIFPMFHVGGLTVHTTPAIHAGATVNILRQFDPGQALKEIERRGVTIMVASPAMARAFTSHPDWENTNISSLRCVALGAAIVTLEVIRPWAERSVPTVVIYGLTEALPLPSGCL